VKNISAPASKKEGGIASTSLNSRCPVQAGGEKIVRKPAFTHIAYVVKSKK
jgi:hypothetical protein